MRLKIKDLALLMDYVAKEKPEFIEVEFDELKFAARFSFKDAEARDCAIKLFDAAVGTTPELTKTMKLYMRNVKPSPDPSSSSS